MTPPNKDIFYAEVYDIVRQIPRGKVLTYGRIAELLGYPNHSRMVGKAMVNAPDYVIPSDFSPTDMSVNKAIDAANKSPNTASESSREQDAPVPLPCHRVVHSNGGTCPAWTEQRILLEQEGVEFKANGTIDMGKYLWQIEE